VYRVVQGEPGAGCARVEQVYSAAEDQCRANDFLHVSGKIYNYNASRLGAQDGGSEGGGGRLGHSSYLEDAEVLSKIFESIEM